MPELEAVEARVDPVVVLMDLARHLIHQENNARKRAQVAGSKELAAQQGAVAAAYQDAAGHVRELARYLDGDTDQIPVAVKTGEIHRRDPDLPVPWRVDAEEEGS